MTLELYATIGRINKTQAMSVIPRHLHLQQLIAPLNGVECRSDSLRLEMAGAFSETNKVATRHQVADEKIRFARVEVTHLRDCTRVTRAARGKNLAGLGVGAPGRVNV